MGFEVNDFGDEHFGGFAAIADGTIVYIDKGDGLAWVLSLYIWSAIDVVKWNRKLLAVFLKKLITAGGVEKDFEVFFFEQFNCLDDFRIGLLNVVFGNKPVV